MPDIFVSPKNSNFPSGMQEAPLKKAEPKPGSFSPLSALVVNPRHINFQDQEKDEQVILLLRQHWITNLPWLFVTSLLLFAPFIFSILISFLVPQLPFTISLAGWIFWYLATFGYIFVNFLIWYFNAQLVTDKRIMDIDFHNLTYKEVSSTHLERVQDVSFRVAGVIRHFFDYGDVFVQTAGSEPNFEFHAVPKPAFVVDKLTDLMATKKEIHEP